MSNLNLEFSNVKKPLKHEYKNTQKHPRSSTKTNLSTHKKTHNKNSLPKKSSKSSEPYYSLSQNNRSFNVKLASREIQTQQAFNTDKRNL